MALRRIPVNVQRAMLDGNTEALRELGRRGGSSPRRTRKATALSISKREQLARDSESVVKQAQEDICPLSD